MILIESTPAFGGDRTSHPLRVLLEMITGPLGDATWNMIHHVIRKTGHFMAYGLLCLAWLRAWRMTWPQAGFLSQAGLALAGTALVATWDEWHQTFLPNRTGSPWDVLLDCCGAATLIVIAGLYLHFSHASKRRTAAISGGTACGCEDTSD